MWQKELPQMFSFSRLLQDASRLYLIDKHTLLILNKRDGTFISESDIPAGQVKDGTVVNYVLASSGLRDSSSSYNKPILSTLALLFACSSGRELQLLDAATTRVIEKINLKDLKLRVQGSKRKKKGRTKGEEKTKEEESVILFNRPQIQDSLFLFSTSSGDIACLDHAGKEKWRYPSQHDEHQKYVSSFLFLSFVCLFVLLFSMSVFSFGVCFCWSLFLFSFFFGRFISLFLNFF